MAKLLTELYETVDTITEAADGGAKKYSISGIFMQSDIGNRNGRIYPKSVMEREVEKYNKEYIKENRAMGELNHPLNRVSVDPREASHLITELKMNGTDVYGKAKVLNTPCGKIVKALMDEGVKFGVSSRALGSLKKRDDGLNEVQSDFSLRTIDIVSDPSAPAAFVSSVMENKEWVQVDGEWVEQYISETKTAIRKATIKELQNVMESRFDFFIKNL